MAYAPEYERLYNYAAYTASNPDDPFPGQYFDQEFNRIKTTLDAMQTNLELIQRDDGELQNEIVGSDQVKAGSAFNLGSVISWSSGAAVQTNDVVIYQNVFYRATSAFNLAASIATDTGAGRLEVLFDFATYIDLADTSATAAAASATAASGSATSAASAKTAAEAARDLAEGYRDDAQAAVNGAKVSVDDTTPGDLETKITSTGGTLVLSTTSPAGDERRNIEVNVGTTVGKIVQVAASDKYPAIDGSNIGKIGEVVLATYTPSGTSQTIILPAGWDHYQVKLKRMAAASGAESLQMQVFTDGGTTPIATSTYYARACRFGASYATQTSSGATSARMNEGSLNGGTPSEMDLDMMVLVDGRFRAHGVGGIKTGNSAVPDVCSCSAQEASTGVNALKFFWSGSASFSAGGEIIVYGVRES